MPTSPPKPVLSRFHYVTNTAPTLTPGTVTIRLANIPTQEWDWLRQIPERRGWKSY